MEHEHDTNLPGENDWLDEILPPNSFAEELGPHESVAAAGLTHPSGMEELLPESAPEEPLPEPEAISEETPEELPAEALPEDAVSTEATVLLDADASIPAGDDETGNPDRDADARERMSPAPFQDEEYREAFGDGTDLAAVFDEAAQPEAPEPSQEEVYTEEIPEEADVPEEDMPVRKGRPRMKRGYGLLGIPHVLATVIWLAIVVAIGVSLGRVIWVCAADVLAFGRDDHPVQITIEDADTIDTIADKLKNSGLIRYPQLFKLYADITDAREDISSGTFTLNTLYDYHALVNSMSYASDGREVVEVTIPEGYRCSQIFALLEQKGVCSAAELEAYAANGELGDYWFLEGVTRGDKYCLEGYLFPDTYLFYTNDDADRVIEKFLDAFDDRFTDLMHERLEEIGQRYAERLAEGGFDQDYIDAHPLTIREIVIIASLIEKECIGPEDSYIISSVIYNRLTSQDFPTLDIDATVIYALGGKDGPLTLADLEVDSPYNTYKNPGLTPGPICNPGRNSLNSALVPTAKDEDGNDLVYYYYAYDPNEGEHHFSRTSAEHEAFLASLEDDE